MRNRTKTLAILLGSILLFETQPAWAGWVLTDRHGDQTLISAGKMREIDRDNNTTWMVTDFRQQRILLVNREQNTYAAASFNEYCRTMQQMVEDSRAMGEQLTGMFDSDSAPADTTKAPKVEIKKLGAGGKIAGLNTVKYQVFADGKLHEELWLTEIRALMSELGSADSMRTIYGCSMGGGDAAENTPTYLKMIGSGYTIKAVTYQGGQAETTDDITRVEKKNIPESAFAMPAGCRKVSLEEAMGMNGQGGMEMPTTDAPAEGTMPAQRSSSDDGVDQVEHAAEKASPGKTGFDLQGMVMKGVSSIFGR